MATLVVLAAVVLFLLSAMSLVAKMSRMRDEGYDLTAIPLLTALKLFGWQATAIWASIIALILVLF